MCHAKIRSPIFSLVGVIFLLNMAAGFSFPNPPKQNLPYRKATLEDFKAAEEVAIYAFDVLGATSANYLGDDALIRKYLMGNFTQIMTPDAQLVVLFPPKGGQPIASEPPGPEGFVNLWFGITGGESVEIYQFSSLTTQDIAPYSQPFQPSIALVRVKGKNDGLVYFSNNDGTLSCVNYLVQLYWDVEVKRDFLGNLQPRISFIYEYIQMSLVQADCPDSMDFILPSQLFPPPPFFIKQ